MIPDYATIPALTLRGLDLYLNRHAHPGGFLVAVLSNDLFSAVGDADDGNQAALVSVCAFVWNKLPRRSWGTPERVRDWLNEEAFLATMPPTAVVDVSQTVREPVDVGPQS